jgi:hypothetical protein
MVNDVSLLFNVAFTFLQPISVFSVCKAQLTGDWLEKRQGAPDTIILIIVEWDVGAPIFTCAKSLLR